MAIYLSRLMLDPYNKRVQSHLANCNEMHRTIMTAFPSISKGDPRHHLGVLYRIEPPNSHRMVKILVQSQEKPAWEKIIQKYPGFLKETEENNPAIKSLDDFIAEFKPKTKFRFRIQGNTIRRINKPDPQIPGSEKWIGKRVPLHTEELKFLWLQRKADKGGFQILQRKQKPVADGWVNFQYSDSPLPKSIGYRQKTRIVFEGTLYDGILEITDANLFRKTFQEGIGAGKAYGFGLISLAPIR